jgi:hypothetical protein
MAAAVVLQCTAAGRPGAVVYSMVGLLRYLLPLPQAEGTLPFE